MKSICFIFLVCALTISFAQDTSSVLSSYDLASKRIYTTVERAVSDYKKGIPVYRLITTINEKVIPLELCYIQTLQELQLSGDHITYLPAEIKNLSHLQILYFNWNSFITFPVELCELKSLKQLKIMGFGKKELPMCFSNLQNLEHLILTDYSFSTFPQSLLQLNNLETLVIPDCKIKSLPDSLFLLPRLKYLYLSNNNIKSLPASISNAKKLEYLDLSENKLPNRLNKIYLTRSEIHQLTNTLNLKKE